jgi:hypothetical protein
VTAPHNTIRVSPDTIEYVWHSGYYDGPITGLARFNDDIYWFEYDYQARNYALSPLRGLKKLRILARWKWFEICVGKHCSYPEGPAFTARRGQWFWRELANLYYRKRVFKAPRKNKETSL